MRGSLAVVRILHITLCKIRGGLWHRPRTSFILITGAVMILVLYLYISFLKKDLGRMGLALQFGGAAGNLIDRLINNGYVIILLTSYLAIFNIADYHCPGYGIFDMK